MNFDGFGIFATKVSSGSGSIPLEAVNVTVRGTSEENRDVVYSLLTDVDGLTEDISLPTPSRIYSLSPDSPEIAYGLYEIKASREGYYSKTISDVAIFDGVRTVLPINMIPYPIFQNDVTYPKNTLDTVVRENERLEGYK